MYCVLNVHSAVNNSWIKKKTYMLEKTSDTVLALLTKSRNVFGSINFGTPNNNSKGGKRQIEG